MRKQGRRPTIALAFATIGRPELAQRFIRSVRTYFPDLPIYVADQSRQVEPMLRFYAENGVQLVRMPFDAGVCASRNRLTAEIKEDYVFLCDDDFVFWPETRFDDAVAVLEAHADIGVVGGRLRNTSASAHEFDQHWEMYFEYDPRNRLLITLPMYNCRPMVRRAGEIEVFLCDAVMNFAVFRRSIFSDKVRWDERFKSNGEHEDFYLNLKVNSPHKVAYLPTMAAEHNHAVGHKGYERGLRGRTDGWRRFLQKWDIDQHLEMGLGARGAEDPAVTLEPDEALRLYGLGPLTAPRALARRPPSWAEAELQRLGLVFRYDPVLKADTDLVLWYRPEQPYRPGERAEALEAHLRWSGSDGRPLVWESDPSVLDVGEGDYWRPVMAEPPLWPAGCAWLRFEVIAAGGSTRIPLCTGFCFNPAPAEGEPDPEACSHDVLALSPAWLAPPELARADEQAASEATASTGPVAVVRSPAPSCLLIDMAQTPGLQTLVLTDADALGAGRLAVRAPAPELEAPRLVAIPDVLSAARPLRISGYDRTGAPVAAEVPRFRPSPLGPRASAKVTAVLTSCGRQDLLERTLDSFLEFNSLQLERIIVMEDGPAGANAPLMRKFRGEPVEWLGTNWWVGQIDAIDCAYALVDTDYIFHLEDDWEFYTPGFVEKSLRILEADPQCFQVWLRALDDTNGHPVAPETELVAGVACRRMQEDYLGLWHGFSFNPGLRRLSDYRRIGSYGEHVGHDKRRPAGSEAGLSQLYRGLGFHAVILSDNEGRGYVRHIGDHRHVFGRSAAVARG